VIVGYLTILIFFLIVCFADQLSSKVFGLRPLSAGFLRESFKKSFFKTSGYTLIELIVVLVLLGLMFGLVVPKFRQAVLSDSLDTTSLRIIGLVEDLRERAISHQVSYVLHLDIRKKELWSFASNASAEEQETARERAYQLPVDVIIEDIWSWSGGKLYDEATIQFSSKGYIEQSMIHLQSDDGRQLSLELTPFLGSIKIHDGYVDLGRG
jgi:prepilin-type N-terminal cleavage/methylation domain-containing protein